MCLSFTPYYFAIIHIKYHNMEMSPLARHAFLGMLSIFMLNCHLNYFFTILHVRRKSATTFSDRSSLLFFHCMLFMYIYLKKTLFQKQIKDKRQISYNWKSWISVFLEGNINSWLILTFIWRFKRTLHILPLGDEVGLSEDRWPAWF